MVNEKHLQRRAFLLMLFYQYLNNCIGQSLHHLHHGLDFLGLDSLDMDAAADNHSFLQGSAEPLRHMLRGFAILVTSHIENGGGSRSFAGIGQAGPGDTQSDTANVGHISAALSHIQIIANLK